MANVASTAIVLASIALPLLLGRLATAVEEGAGDGYIQALRTGVRAQPVSSSATHPRLLDQHYYFMSGCVGSDEQCMHATPDYWGDYYDKLHTLYDEAVVTAPYEQPPTFERWSTEHAHFLTMKSSPAGARSLARELAENTASGDIHLVGTSTGGSAIFTYLSRAMCGEVRLDRRIRSVLTVDAPLGFSTDNSVEGLVHGALASLMRSSVQPGVGEWAKAAGIATLTVDSVEDAIGHDPLPGVPNDANPVYPQSDKPPTPAFTGCTSFLCRLVQLPDLLGLGGTWHIYTGSHMADSARQFVDRLWR